MANKLPKNKKTIKKEPIKHTNPYVEKITQYFKNNLDSSAAKSRAIINEIISTVLMELLLGYICFKSDMKAIAIAGIIVTLFNIVMSIIKLYKKTQQRIQNIVFICTQLVFLLVFIYIIFK